MKMVSRVSARFGMNLLIPITFVFFLQSNVRAEDRELPLFPENYATPEEDPFKKILEEYRGNNFARAAAATDQLLQRLSEGPLSETASFLRGDIQLKWAQTGGTKHLHRAISAFHEAQQRYPDSENAIRGLWRIGQAYEQLGFNYEAIGSFKRILLRHPNSRFAPLAQIGIAQTYRGWKKWTEAAEAYEGIHLDSLSPEDQTLVLVGHADSLFHQNQFEAAYRKYEQGKALSGSRPTPVVLFQHAESAYRTGRTGQARQLFFNLLTLSSRDPLAPVAFVRTADTWRREGVIDKAGLVYTQVLAAPGTNPSGGLDKLIAAIGQITMQACGAPVSSKPLLCQTALDEEGLHQALELVETQARIVLQASRLDDFAQETLLEAIEQFRTYGAFTVALDLEEHLMAFPSASHFKLRLTAVYRKTIGEEIGRLAKKGDDLKIVELFHARSADFTPPMLTGPTGLQVGVSHARLGLHAQAIELFSPIAASLSNRSAEEALFLLGKSLLEEDAYDRAEQKLSAFIKRYPRSPRILSVLVDLGGALDRQGKADRAIEIYHKWLLKYPSHPHQERISLLLAKAYQRKGNFREEAAIYQKWMSRNPSKSADLALDLGEAYYHLREYGKAIQLYQTVLKENPETSKEDWIRFQMAKSYHAMGQRDRGSSLFDQLVQNAKDPLMRQMAAEEKASLKQKRGVDGNRRKEG
ncbi:MAG: tetratricopeptide repeat protein [Nitrospirae bacterium]|nr:tetratricopeptide repeat protein [Candidatus Manganitrophaceae bacterium]